ncbi:UNVERIFIED_CONTAM: hypothetical protein PYX00_003814 [Menopon gallinae]|uniref:Histone deacetylase domain-containing protein n=1 Tax=Menopon gallinae TaxID=328185 RepID=A0AAW2I2Z0_9NEOP
MKLILNRLPTLLHISRARYSHWDHVSGLPVVHHDGYTCSLPPNHPFPMEKFLKIMDVLERDDVIVREKQVVQPRPIDDGSLKLVHTAKYLDKFLNGKLSEEEQKVSGFRWKPELVERVRYETGGTLLASKIALNRGLACSTAGGTHHAFPDRATGYCLINDLAVAARYLKEKGLADKILIVDLDVHQGDGTAAVFKDDPSVFTFSMHCESNFPLRKEESNLDVPLLKKLEDKPYLKLLADHLEEVLDSFRPSLVIYDAGVDVHEADNLGHLSLTDQGILKRDLYVLKQSIKRGISVCAVVGGGYSKDLDELATRHSILHRAATRVYKEKHL